MTSAEALVVGVAAGVLIVGTIQVVIPLFYRVARVVHEAVSRFIRDDRSRVTLTPDSSDEDEIPW